MEFPLLSASFFLIPHSSAEIRERTLLVQGPYVSRYLNVPGVPPDSNAVERALNCSVVIRKNSLFYHNEVSAYRAGMLMTLAGSCVAAGCDPISYMTAPIASPLPRRPRSSSSRLPALRTF
ncbi:IS66 family transposase [Sulfidibacter corallicola]|uniref:Transposase n=1 Tax=Sulfidibacter corallicola TaxID=2818388 RepID=A0A8A4TP40_SULCO|nr:transposase [Sulfidibacter corallicola]